MFEPGRPEHGLAAALNVSHATISDVRAGRRWAHLEGSA